MIPLVVSAIISIFIFSFATISELPTSMPEVYSALAFSGENEPHLPVNADRQLPSRVEENEDFQIDANSGAVWDISNRYFVFEKNSEDKVSLASITKLMTALTFLDHNPGWDKEYEIRADDRREGGKIYMFLGDRAIVRDLFYTSLVGSANTATIALVHSTGMTEEEFVKEMNKKAFELGLFNTVFLDATGLRDGNVSTAKDVARLASFALSNEDISNATLTQEHIFSTLSGSKKRIETTDELLKNFNIDNLHVLGGKTGYTESAGYCFVGLFADDQGRRVVSVVMGAKTQESRFSETVRLIDKVFSIDK